MQCSGLKSVVAKEHERVTIRSQDTRLRNTALIRYAIRRGVRTIWSRCLTDYQRRAENGMDILMRDHYVIRSKLIVGHNEIESFILEGE
ncbi:jg6168 [Pararge aegeria aegeria]|uniref:Jg6168 protein n=1 Tax=Pararge aegeria aegeria TaxID=348720 RepID=A0A8S4RQK0_9NEOP|nr:jg6168 [Pararge aegeria aegeria]